VENFQIAPSTVYLDYHLGEGAFLHVACAYHPFLKITLDGKRVHPYHKTALGFIAMKSPRGFHHLKIEPGSTRLGSSLMGFALLVLVFLLRVLILAPLYASIRCPRSTQKGI
jgi:hypothetical protein